MRKDRQYNVRNLLKVTLLTVNDLFALDQIVHTWNWLLLVRMSFALVI